MSEAFTIYPAIDLKDGACVRLEQGDMGRATIFSEDPAAQATFFQSLGFRSLHLVDLNGAFAGEQVNGRAVNAILRATDLEVQLGGGIRDLASIESWLKAGVTRIVLGTAAVREPALVEAACKAFPGQIAVGIDARAGRVAVQGWAEATDLTAEDLAARFADAGVAAIIYTDIERDGIRAGVNVEATAGLARAIDIPVIASGGVGGLADIEALLGQRDAGIVGVIVGRALYDGALDARAAMDLLAG